MTTPSTLWRGAPGNVVPSLDAWESGGWTDSIIAPFAFPLFADPIFSGWNALPDPGFTPVQATRDNILAAAVPVLNTDTNDLITIGSTTYTAAGDLQVTTADATYGTDGQGITIGVISDSFDAATAVARGSNAAAAFSSAVTTEESDGDLPTTVKVLKDYSAGTDEGRAMAELVHAMAPDATIDFATAEGGEQIFANDILALAKAGATVIVDDVSYYNEPFFNVAGSATNVIQAAIATVTAEGVSYFTAAGNDSSGYYEAPITTLSADLPGAGSASTLMNFGATAASVSGSDTLQQITISGGATMNLDLQWNQPFRTANGISGSGSGSAYGLTIYLYSLSGTLETSVTSSIGRDPFLLLTYTNPSGSSTAYDIAIAVTSGTVPGGAVLKYIPYGSVTINDSDSGQNSTVAGSGATYGHEGLADANTVAAASVITPTSLEYYTSVGTISFTSVDGVDTSVSGFSTFYGTSAAAPNAAAVAVLMQQVNPNLTAAEVTSALVSTADGLTGGETAARAGAGLINADAAIAAVYGTGWTIAGGGAWSDAAGWSPLPGSTVSVLPTATTYVTLASDLGTLTTSYTVTVDIPTAAADTLTIGNADPLTVTLAIAQNAALTVAGGLTMGTDGSIDVAAGGTLAVGGKLAGGLLTLSGGADLILSATSTLDTLGGWTAPIALTQGTSTIDLTGISDNGGADTFALNGDTLDVEAASTTVASLVIAGGGAHGSITQQADTGGGLELLVACYVTGTRIATPRGDVPIEALRINDLVRTTAGEPQPIRWIGRRRYTAAQLACSPHLRPIRIQSGALAAGLPRRDLLVSPEHALLLPDLDTSVLIPAGHLVNHTSITREPATAVTYLHLELDGHAVILAENQPAETFIDDNSRNAFDNAADYAGPPQVPPPEFCAPRLTAGPAVQRIRAAIAARAQEGDQAREGLFFFEKKNQKTFVYQSGAAPPPPPPA